MFSQCHTESPRVGALSWSGPTPAVPARNRFVEEGLEAALTEKPRPGAAPVLNERGEATLLALACANPPTGRAAWSMQLLADELVQRQVVGSISDETVRRVLKKKNWRPGFASAGASPR